MAKYPELIIHFGCGCQYIGILFRIMVLLHKTNNGSSNQVGLFEDRCPVLWDISLSLFLLRDMLSLFLLPFPSLFLVLERLSTGDFTNKQMCWLKRYILRNQIQPEKYFCDTYLRTCPMRIPKEKISKRKNKIIITFKPYLC